MKNLPALLSLCMCGLAAAAVPEVAMQPKAKPDAVRTFLEDSALNADLDLALAMLRQASADQIAAQAPGSAHQKYAREFQAAALKCFEHDSMYQAILDYVKEHYDPVKASAYLAWLRSPKGRMISSAQRSTSAPSPSELEAFGQWIQSHPPGQERLELLERLDQALMLTAGSVQSYVEFSRIMMMGFVMSLPPEERQRFSVERVEAKIENGKALMDPEIRQGMRDRMLFMFRALPDSELRELVKSCESDAVHWYVHLENAAMKQAWARGALRLGKELGQDAVKSSP